MSGAFEVVAATRRSGLDESWHHGAVVGLAADGSVAFTVGDPAVVVYPRSTHKPFQAAAMVAAGLDLPPSLLALVCASHAGTARHVEGVRAILATAGLDEHALANTADLPLDPAAAADLLRAGGDRAPVYMNCSGKHAAMVVTSVANGWPAADGVYLDPDHPLQRRVVEVTERYTGQPVTHVGVDGCGAPAVATSLLALARGVRALVRAEAAVYQAMTAHPEMVGGAGLQSTALMRAVPGLCAKDGAEGMFVASLPDGPTVAVKIADGAARARPVVVAASFALMGVDVPALWAAARVPVLGHGHPVGEVGVAGPLAAALARRG